MKIILHFLIFFLLCACNKTDRDTQNPNIGLVSLSHNLMTDDICGNTYDNIIKITRGEELKIKFKVDDNQMVSRYKVILYDLSNCSESSAPNYLGVLYDSHNIVMVNEKDATIDRSWTINNVFSNKIYLLEFIAIDEAENESVDNIKIYLKIDGRWNNYNPIESGGKDDWNNNILVDTLKPRFIFLTSMDTVSLIHGLDSIHIEGTLYDNLPLDNVQVTHYISYNNNIEGAIQQFNIFSSLNSKYLNFAYHVDSSLIHESFKFHLKIIDGAQNVLEIEQPFVLGP